jgi:hypothetical protein
MNHPRQKDFEAHVLQAISDISASPSRKRTMHEELLAHMLGIYDDEQTRGQEERAAITETKRRLGDADQLRTQLQASVPLLERLFFMCLNPKETSMSRLLWILAIVGAVTWFIGSGQQMEFVGMALLWAAGFAHLCRENNLAARWLGSRWPLYIGPFSALFGLAVVLPALAKMKHAETVEFIFLEALIIGLLIMLFGLGFIVHGLKNLRTRAA